jgi:hypothetical protein
VAARLNRRGGARPLFPAASNLLIPPAREAGGGDLMHPATLLARTKLLTALAGTLFCSSFGGFSAGGAATDATGAATTTDTGFPPAFEDPMSMGADASAQSDARTVVRLNLEAARRIEAALASLTKFQQAADATLHATDGTQADAQVRARAQVEHASAFADRAQERLAGSLQTTAQATQGLQAAFSGDSDGCGAALETALDAQFRAEAEMREASGLFEDADGEFQSTVLAATDAQAGLSHETNSSFEGTLAAWTGFLESLRSAVDGLAEARVATKSMVGADVAGEPVPIVASGYDSGEVGE